MKHGKHNVLDMKSGYTKFLLLLLLWISSLAVGKTQDYVSAEMKDGSFPLVASGQATPLYASEADHKGVHYVLEDLQADVNRVTGIGPEIHLDAGSYSNQAVLIGTIGKSPLIDQLIKNNKLNVDDITGKRETFLIQPIENPLPGVDHALVIAGSDKRGTIYGMYDLSEQMGVSPWYWWADAPVQQKENVYILPGRHTMGEPAVKYRGIFINDEEPALGGWVRENFDDFNHKFYENVFELILRMKGNYLWPAMWGKAFYDDDSLNAVLADEYGVVIGTSHHEPLMRAHVEWDRYGEGDWNYETNEETLREFWKEGIERMGDNENVVTVGMRGDGDEPMTEGTAIDLLERIVHDQREIIEEVTGKDAAEVPQVWALYKEVQEYYDHGMRVPDDVTLLLCDDNWGNIRKLPELDDTARSGGFGIYYHFDYVGGPRNYKWLNTTQIERTWEQMRLAYEYGARELWIVNVGDIKPMELPIDFFLDYAWDPASLTAEDLPQYYHSWAAQQFGNKFTDEIAHILSTYTKYNSRRKPELLSPETYSLIHYQEAERIVDDYNTLAEKAEDIYNQLPESHKAAYYQLVLFPVKACANLNELYVSAGKNKLYAEQGRALTNEMAEKVRKLFQQDAEMANYFHTELADGKWNHMMSQTHIGYTYWQQPEQNNMPEVEELKLKKGANMGVAIQGSDKWWPNAQEKAVLPEFDAHNMKKGHIELFNRGKDPFDYQINPGAAWIKLSSEQGTVEKQERLWVSIDWEQVPAGINRAPITITGPDNNEVTVEAVVHHNKAQNKEQLNGHIGSADYVSIEAVNYTQAVGSKDISWETIPNLGRTLSAIMPVPVTSPDQVPGNNSPHLEYKIMVRDTGKINITTYLSPTLNFHNDEGLQYAISVDDEEPQIVNMHTGEDSYNVWASWVSNNVNKQTSEHDIDNPGEHTIKFWMVDPGVVLQKIVVETGDLAPSYLGPPESFYRAGE